MTLLFVAAFVVLVIVLVAADRAVKAHVTRRRRRSMEERLASAKASTDVKVEKQRQAAQAREALTSVMPSIYLTKPRHVNEPSLSSSHDRRVA
jgi:hypothetical protein